MALVFQLALVSATTLNVRYAVQDVWLMLVL